MRNLKRSPILLTHMTLSGRLYSFKETARKLPWAISTSLATRRTVAPGPKRLVGAALWALSLAGRGKSLLLPAYADGKLAFGTRSPIDADRRPDCRVIELFWQWRLQMGSDERAIREVHTTWIDAVNAGDLVRLLTLMADDVVFLNPGRAPFGRDGFPVGFAAAHQQSHIRCISELEEVVIVGEVAYTRCRDSLSATPRSGGEAMELAGHRITIYRKQPDGRWLLARDANTLSPVAS